MACTDRCKPVSPGAAYLDAHVPALLDTSLYFADGQIHDEVFEYGSFLQSRMAQCVNCHMPARTCMVVDSRHDHGFRVPDPWLSEEAGSPDVCTTCHQDRDAAWAQQV